MFVSMRGYGLEGLERDLAEALAAVMGGTSCIASVTPHVTASRKDSRQGKLAFLVSDRDERRAAVLLTSSPVEPDQVALDLERARQAKLALGPDLGRVILDPLGEGRVAGLSYAIMPYCPSLSRSRVVRTAQRCYLRPKLLRWLYLANMATVLDPCADEIERDFAEPLAYLSNLTRVHDRVRSAAARGLDRLRDGQWSPRLVLMHKDFCEGNILLGRVGGFGGDHPLGPFVVIDWPGSQVRGYPIYDLIRLACSMRLGTGRLREEVTAHCSIVDCDLADAASYLMTALGKIGLTLGELPFDEYVRLSMSCLGVLESIGCESRGWGSVR